MNPNQFEFSLTDRDLAEAFKVAYRRLFRAYLNWKTAVWFSMVVALFIGIGYWNGWVDSLQPPAPIPTTQSAPPSDSWLYSVPTAALIVFGAASIFLLLRAQHKNHRLADVPHSLVVESDGIIWTSPFSRLEYQWAVFCGIHETKNLFLLYLSNSKSSHTLEFHIVPKRAFPSPEQLAQFKKLLETSIHPRVSRFPVIPPALPADPEKPAT